MLAGQVGKSDAFEQAIPGFAVATFDASEQDHAEFVRAADGGRVKAVLNPRAWRPNESKAPFCGSGGYRFKPGWSPNSVNYLRGRSMK